MPVLRWIIVVLLLIPAGTAAAQSMGSLEVTGRVRISGKVEKLMRKRFFLFRGGLDANRALVDRIKAANVVSRDCYYCTQKASDELLAWLRAEDCESPYCRAISAEDAKAVPEFLAAYQKGLRQFRNRPTVARQWLTTNLAPNLRDGFYRQRRSSLESLLAGTRPLQSSMTDSVSVRAGFIDIPVKPEAGKTTETFMVSNVLPVEFQGKSYLWACEVDIGSKKLTLALQVPDPGKSVRRCEVIVKDLPVCLAGACVVK